MVGVLYVSSLGSGSSHTRMVVSGVLDAKKPLVFYAPKMRLLKRQMERSFSVLMAIHVAYAKVSSAPKLLFVLFVSAHVPRHLLASVEIFSFYSC